MTPRLSVVIPVYNEAATVETLIERVQRADVPIPLEIVAMDDASVDETRRFFA